MSTIVMWSHDIAKVDTHEYILFNMERFGKPIRTEISDICIGAKWFVKVFTSDKTVKQQKIYDNIRELQKKILWLTDGRHHAPVLAQPQDAQKYRKNKIHYCLPTDDVNMYILDGEDAAEKLTGTWTTQNKNNRIIHCNSDMLYSWHFIEACVNPSNENFTNLLTSEASWAFPVFHYKFRYKKVFNINNEEFIVKEFLVADSPWNWKDVQLAYNPNAKEWRSERTNSFHKWNERYHVTRANLDKFSWIPTQPPSPLLHDYGIFYKGIESAHPTVTMPQAEYIIYKFERIEETKE